MMAGSPIQKKLRRTIKKYHTDSLGYSTEIANPDGEEGAAFIDNALKHVGEITYLALNNISDPVVREEISRRAIAAMRGVE
jgi:hypothetical protein